MSNFEITFAVWNFLTGLATACAAVAAAIAAIMGLNRWRIELKWKHDRDLAVELLANFDAVTGCIRSVVSEKSHKDLNLNSQEEGVMNFHTLIDHHNSLKNILKSSADAFNTTTSKVYILWGDDLENLNDSVLNYYHEFQRVTALREGALDHRHTSSIQQKYRTRYKEYGTSLNIKMGPGGDFELTFDAHREFLKKIIRSKNLR